MAPRRLYGKGSCTLCQLRKTRCELPAESLNLPPSPDPLPTESACHRCRTLSLSCIIQAPTAATARAPRKTSQSGPLQSAPPSPAEPTSIASSSSSTLVVKLGLPSAYETCALAPAERAPSQSSNSSVAPLLGNSAYSGQYHGRPLELASALFRGSFPPSAVNYPLASPTSGLSEVLRKYGDAHLRAQARFTQLCTFAPFLFDLPTLMTHYSTSPTPSLTPLLSAILLLCCAGDKLLSRDLSNIVLSSMRTVNVQSPDDLHAVQAFILLAIFAPFGTLPGQPAMPTELVVARGYIRAAKSAAASISLQNIVSPASLFAINAWYSVELWTWLSLCAIDAAMALESESIISPPELIDAQEVVVLLSQLAEQAVTGDAGAVGKILLCERVMRLTTVHTGMSSFPQILVASSIYGAKLSIANLTVALQSSLDELDESTVKSDILTGCCSMVAPSRPCLLVRDTERLADIGLLRRTAIRHLLALSMLANADPSATANSNHAVAAMSRAVDPASVAELFQRKSSSPSVVLLQTWIRQRGMALEDLLIGLLASDQGSAPFLLPVHRIAAIAVESCSVIVELQAALFTVSRSSRIFRQNSRIRPRSGILRQVAGVMRTLEAGWIGHGGMYIGEMSSRLIASMVDGAEEAARRYDGQEMETGTATGGASVSQIQPASAPPEPTEMEIWLYQLTNGLLPGDLDM